MKRTCVIYNPQAGTATAEDELIAACAPLGDVALRATTPEQSAKALAAAALTEGFDLIVAAGGDGTINEVVNGLAADWGRATLGIIPRGTGNDFARTIDVPTELDAAVAVLVAGQTEVLDIIQVESTSDTNYFINVSTGGFSGLVDEKLTDEMKASWGPLAYLHAATLALPDLTNYKMQFRFDDEEPQLLPVYNIVVANGRYVAGGWPVVPNAILDDGLMDVVIVPQLSAVKIGLLAPQLFLGKHINSDELIVRRARSFAVDSQPGMWFNVDGELVGNEPAHFTVLPQKLRVIVGPEYERVPDTN